jgi:small subunit ribosomal protein S6
MEHYEVALLLKPLLPDDIKNRVVGAIQKLTSSLGGELETKEVWGKKHLAYSIKGHEEGYYIFFKLELAPAQVKEFSRSLRLMSDVLRFLVIKETEL